MQTSDNDLDDHSMSYRSVQHTTSY